jgi:hypothetical protein
MVVLADVIAVSICFAEPSSNFYQEDHRVFDDWHVCRTSAQGEDGFFQLTEAGFRPVIAFESLGQYTETAYSLGEEFAERYPDADQRAEQIFYFVRDRVRYISDSDQFGFSEFAQNADELANTIQEQGFASGDCEDSAILLTVMYKGAGYRSAIVLAPNHAAAIVHLPGYQKANVVLSWNGEQGWIWAEATGRNNPFGWFPEEFIAADLVAYEISAEPISIGEPPAGEEPAVTKGGVNPVTMTYPFFAVVGLMMFIILLMRKRRA